MEKYRNWKIIKIIKIIRIFGKLLENSEKFVSSIDFRQHFDKIVVNLQLKLKKNREVLNNCISNLELDNLQNYKCRA